MPKTLAELRASRAVALPERTFELCLSQALVAEAQALSNEKVELALGRTPTEDGAAKPRRAGQPEDVRLAEIDTRLEELFDEMREHTGTLLLRGVGTGEWILWRDENPPRKDGVDKDGRPIINPVDAAIAFGWCNADALVADLGRFAAAWNGEPIAAGEWDFIYATAAPGDLKAMVSLVVEMHEGGGSRAPKASSKPSHTSTPSGSGSSSPAASESPSASS